MTRWFHLLIALCISSLTVARADELATLAERIRRNPGTAAREGAFRQLVITGLAEGKTREALQSLAEFIGLGFNRNPKRELSFQQLDLLAHAADASVFLALAERQGGSTAYRRDVLDWLAGDAERFELFLNTVSPEDDWQAMMAIFSQLYDHDPKQRDEYFALILALAVVWDQSRPPLHNQTGGKQLPYEPDLPARYEYFRDLYASRRSAMPYRDLSVTALTFVVDVPVPLAELQWLRENEQPRAWDKKYSDIVYSDRRLNAKIYQWPHGPYNLAAIKEQGGICVDQGYYAVLAARAWGLPALLFTGEGRRGPHAWFGYMRNKTSWETEVGRYTYDKYAAGHAVDPQTNQPMSDHYVEYACDRTLAYDRYRGAARYARLGHVLAALGYPSAARQAADRSVTEAPLYEFGWQVLETLLAKEQANQELVDLLERKANTFRRHDEFVAVIHHRQAEVLRAMGENERADRLIDRKARSMGRSDRDDLARFLSNEQIKIAYEKGDYAGALKRFEDLLRDQRHEGHKVFNLMEEYLALAAATDQNAEAAKFLGRFVNTLRGLYARSNDNERLFLNILAKAYEQAGDERNLARTRKQLADLR
ncbi:MAG: hypothetical protein RBU25_12125 [Lentisphaeria bacterium]|jgi:hypothetical protein|nr:hypothetical protein [Lentisphaeria bacterium]